MLAVDTNVLVYAPARGCRARARAPSRPRPEGTSTWAIPWPCVYESFSVVTNPRIWKDAASTPAQAWAQMEAWTAAPSLRLLAETANFEEVLGGFARRPRVRGPLIHEARVAAICVVHGVEALLSRDRDFSLFPELTVSNPFAEDDG